VKKRTLLESFNNAIEGMIHVLKTQRNMRIHFLAGFFVLILTLFFKLSKLEFLTVFFSIALVIVAELLNTSIEATIDLTTDDHHELAKIAKDVAAAAVLVAAINAVFIGYLVFFNRLGEVNYFVLQKLRSSPPYVTGIALALTSLLVVSAKAWGGSKSYLRGGWPSGHAALAGALFTALALLSRDFLMSSLALALALLVFESRIEGRVHTWFEVLSGALLGILTCAFIFQIFLF
jgi:diacylglycerol kinase (ATP)